MEKHMEYDRFVVDWEQVAGSTDVAKAVLVDAQLDAMEDMIWDQLRYQVRGYILAGAPVDVSVSVIVPDPKTHWHRFLQFATIDAWTRLGQWIERKADHQIPRRTVTETRTVNRNVCPHGVEAKRQDHLEFLVMNGSPSFDR